MMTDIDYSKDKENMINDGFFFAPKTYCKTHDNGQVDANDRDGIGGGRYFFRNHQHKNGKGNETS